MEKQYVKPEAEVMMLSVSDVIMSSVYGSDNYNQDDLVWGEEDNND